MDIYLVRHGQSVGNGCGRMIGWSDHPLSADGCAQAAAVAARLQPLGPMPVYCSDLARARVTAEAIAGGWQGAVEVDPRWREIHCGRYEDAPWDAFTADAALQCRFDADPLGTPMPDGESVEMLMARVIEAFTALLRRPDARLVVVAHDGPIRAVLAHCLQIPAARFWAIKTEHGGVTHLQVSDDWISVCAVNDTSHLTMRSPATTGDEE